MIRRRDLKSHFQDKVLLLVCVCLLLSFPAQAAEETASLSIPPDFGRIDRIEKGSNGKTIVLIQEAHVDYGAQKAIAEILKSLIEKDSLRLVLVEGGWDDMTLSYFRAYGSKEGRLEVAERYLKEGKISGEEYLDVVSDLDFKIWGIENPKFYEENMQAFFKIQPEQDRLISKISQFESLLDQLAEKIFSPDLQELQKKKSLFEEGKLNLFDYLLTLKKLAGSEPSLRGAREGNHSTVIARSEATKQSRSGLLRPHLDRRLAMTDNTARNDGFALTPTLQKLIHLSEEEGGINSEKAEQEKQALIRALSQKLTKPELAKIELLRGRKSSQEELEFIKSLLEVHQKYYAHPSPHPSPLRRGKGEGVSIENLKRYFHALDEANRVNPDLVFSELERLEKEITDRVLLTSDQKKLENISRRFQTLKKLFQLNLDSESFEALERDPSTFDLKDWNTFVQAKAAEFSIPMETAFDPVQIEGWISEAKNFYISARKREEALIENTVEKMEAEKSSKAALIVGGFHSEKLAKALNERGYSVVVVAPRFTPADLKSHDQHYFEILKYKWDSKSNVSLSPSQKLS